MFGTEKLGTQAAEMFEKLAPHFLKPQTLPKKFIGSNVKRCQDLSNSSRKNSEKKSKVGHKNRFYFQQNKS
jgi:hypothetical protein